MTRQIWFQLLATALLPWQPLAAQQPPSAGAPITVTGNAGFEELRTPQFVPASKASFMKDEDRIMGIVENGVSKAYRTDMVARHHIIEDQFGKKPVLPTW